MPLGSENTKEGHSVLYSGPVWYRWRQLGIEEGAHAGYFGTRPLKVHSSLEAAKVIDNRFSSMPPVLELTTPLPLITTEKLEDLLDCLDPFCEFFEGERRTRAVELLSNLVEGALECMRSSLSEEELSNVGLGVAKFPKGSRNTPSAFYDPEDKLIIVDINTLKADSSLESDTQIVLDSTNTGHVRRYLKQPHEREALDWLIEDAKSRNMDTQAGVLKDLIKLSSH